MTAVASLFARLADRLRGRPAAILLAVAVHALVLLLLLRLAPEIPFFEDKKGTTTVELLPDEGEAQTKSAVAQADTRPAGGGGAPRPRPPAPVEPKVVEPPPPPPVPKVDYLRLTDAELSSLDRTLATRSSAPAGNAAGTGEGPGQVADAGPGGGGETGPNGERLYPADWQRRPTKAELGFYLPKGVSGYGIVACRTIENYRVTDCHELDQSPPGSGLSRAVREAAWQFRVRPPRVGGKVLVGAWVRIRIDYIRGEVR